MNISSSINRPLLILAVLLVTSGCYTVLNHPAVETSSEDYEYTSCYDCHNDSFFHYGYRPMPYPGIWETYYHEPWWHSEILIAGEGGRTFRRSVIPGRDFRTREDDGRVEGRKYDRESRINVMPALPRSDSKQDGKVRERKVRTPRSRSDKRRKARDRPPKRSSSGKKKKKERDRD